MLWHTGYSLSQSIYTCRFIHHLSTLNPAFFSANKDYGGDRPAELATVVIRAATLGLIKSCDLVYRELSKGRVIDVSGGTTGIGYKFNDIVGRGLAW